ncbi:hypothetical protein N9T98_00075 [bacterium]|nr:hypothetical protein [bacterium]
MPLTDAPRHADDAGSSAGIFMALRANDADCYKSWLALGIEELGMEVTGEIESDWMVPLLVEEEMDRLIGLAAGCEPLTPLRDRSAAKITRMGDSDSLCFSDGKYIEGRPSHTFK